MSDFNRVILIGRLTRDPELRYTPGGQAVCNIGLAIGREWKNKDGEKQKETTFLRIVVWGKTGESCGSYLKKGREVLIEGRLQSRSWEGADGKKNSAVEVVADSVQFLGGRDRAGGGADGERESKGSTGPDDDIPF